MSSDSDPTSSDSSSDEDFEVESSSKARKRQRKSPYKPLENVSSASVATDFSSISRNSKSKSTYVGAYRMKSGRFSSEIRDRSAKKRYYLGSFDSAEAAHLAYSAKKKEIQEKAASEKTKIDRIPRTPKKKLEKSSSSHIGAHRRKSGKWSSEIMDPITKNRIYMGTFESEEAAHEAYCAKKLEIDEKAAFEGNEKGTFKGIMRNGSDGWGSRVLDPVTKNRIWLGTFETEEAAYRAYCAKKAEIEKGENTNTKKKTYSKSPQKGVPKRQWRNEASCEKAAPQKEQQQEVASDFNSVPLIIDENGFLLGEFSKIDDLTIL